MVFDIVLVSASALALIVFFFVHAWRVTPILAGLSFLGLIPVVLGAISSLKAGRVSVDLLASIALVFSLLQSEWSSAAFITLMLASARIFDHVTANRAKQIIQSLMKFQVEKVCLKTGDDVRPVHISQVKPGDLVIVESGDRLPVDGEVVSGEASVDESTLTGESELVPKKIGDQVFTATMNEAGSLVVKALKVGADTALARIMSLVEEASRSKSRAERVADTFTQWYIGLTLAGSIVMYALGFAWVAQTAYYHAGIFLLVRFVVFVSSVDYHGHAVFSTPLGTELCFVLTVYRPPPTYQFLCQHIGSRSRIVAVLLG